VTLASAVAAVVFALGLASDVDSSDFRYTRTLTAPTGAAVSFEPDGAMYAHARADFPDLRVVDADGTQVPWRTAPLAEAFSQRVALVARGRVDDVVSVVVDRRAAPRVIDRIELEVPDRDFVGAAEVLGSPRGRGLMRRSRPLRSTRPRCCERTQHDGAVPSDGLPLPPRSGTRRVRCHRRTVAGTRSSRAWSR
jgi:hypothetical protein